MSRLDRIATLAALGPANIARVATYRLGLRAGLHPVLKLKADVPSGPIFDMPRRRAPERAVARESWRETALYFGFHEFALDGPPDWHANPFRPGVKAHSERHWSRIPDFDPAVGDIKTVWEASRLDWLIAMAQRAAAGDAGELDRLNAWLADWVSANPPYQGANWKCGQEASIRVMHLALAALILGQVERPLPGLVAMLRLHLARIAPTMGYAIGQQNNHGTSEAAALFIGGSWLERLGDGGAAQWAATGRRWLEDRARQLIEPDGTFSQYSVVYHRVMLDTYCLAEVWRRQAGLPDFSRTLVERLAAATEWLRQMTESATGGAPNLGANDGARLIVLTDTDYRDFRPSVQLASVLFSGARAWQEEGAWDQPLIWLGIETDGRALPEPGSISFDDGGLHVLRKGATVAYLRYPRFRFRPSQADALHLDLWVGGDNLLRDAGTYSYNASDEDTAYFPGTAAHNTVAFDGRDQMPRLGRFLFGAWLKARDVARVSEDAGILGASAGYRDSWGSSHHREVWLSDDRLVCRDRLEGSAENAVLRWRLMPGDWRLEGTTVTNDRFALTVSSDHPIRRIELSVGFESEHYLRKTPLPVLEVETTVPAVLETRIDL